MEGTRCNHFNFVEEDPDNPCRLFYGGSQYFTEQNLRIEDRPTIAYDVDEGDKEGAS